MVKKASRTSDRIQINKDNIQFVTELKFSTRTGLPQENPATDPGERERVGRRRAWDMLERKPWRGIIRVCGTLKHLHYLKTLETVQNI